MKRNEELMAFGRLLMGIQKVCSSTHHFGLTSNNQLEIILEIMAAARSLHRLFGLEGREVGMSERQLAHQTRLMGRVEYLSYELHPCLSPYFSQDPIGRPVYLFNHHKFSQKEFHQDKTLLHTSAVGIPV